MKRKLSLTVAFLIVALAAQAVLASTVIVLTSGTSWTVPADWNSASNTIELIGAGGGGQGGNAAAGGGAGGGGGRYGKKANVTLTPGASITVQFGQGGAGGATGWTPGSTGTDTIFNSSATTVAATLSPGIAVQGGKGGGATGSMNAGVGGTTSFGTDSGANGGNGGNDVSSLHGSAGGGGAGGPAGAGAVGGTGADNGGSQGGSGGGGADGGTAGATPGGTGAGAGGANGSAVGKGGDGGTSAVVGSAGTSENTWGTGIGPGGGGGGPGSGYSGANTAVGGTGGGGAGGSFSGAVGATGGNGIIVITYTSATPAAPSSLSATTVSGSRINISFTANDGGTATSYTLQWDIVNTFTSPSSQTINQGVTTAAVTNLSPLTTYYFRICANNASGSSSFSNTASATTLAASGVGPNRIGIDIGIGLEAAANSDVTGLMGWTTTRSGAISTPRVTN